MQVVIFAGGLGTRLSEETDSKPKPMVEIGGKPILWHILKIYQSQGFNDFIICLGYKGYYIKEYFINYSLHNSDITIDISQNKTTVHANNSEDFKVTLVETGLNTLTAGRLKRIKNYITSETFMLTYGDGVANINLKELKQFHSNHTKIATMTVVETNNRYGIVKFNEANQIVQFEEKPKDNWVNGGFFVLNKKVFDYLPEDSDTLMWEQSPLKNLAGEQQLMAYQHKGFWKAMDALRDKIELEKLWTENKAEWKTW
jgi:glucose-1-phosphate cytidylyltransferase